MSRGEPFLSFFFFFSINEFIVTLVNVLWYHYVYIRYGRTDNRKFPCLLVHIWNSAKQLLARPVAKSLTDSECAHSPMERD